MPETSCYTNNNNNIYLVYYFSKSPIYNIQVKLTSSNIYYLRAEPGFKGRGKYISKKQLFLKLDKSRSLDLIGKNIYFFLNYSIYFVQLVSSIILITDYRVNRIILSLNNGSGSIVKLKVTYGLLVAASYKARKSKSQDTLLTDVPNLVLKISRLGALDLFSSAIPLCISIVIKVKGTLSKFRGEFQVSLYQLSVI